MSPLGRPRNGGRSEKTFGWRIIAGLVIRLGLGAESLACAAIFFIQLFSAVYYPIDTLPASGQEWWRQHTAEHHDGAEQAAYEHARASRQASVDQLT